ncbi:putative glycosyltransferase [Gordonia polyisoprenivorans NBRC 16320 = JCM 10675]|uniref:Glycosyltransferase family 2 protein n=1 Tax=Gordonia polyisoprenivorans TaxID=84595 RepID=A0A846WNF3_9ACTN|nr:glycosyltransferase family 2 protein [Gordonia polyisoprenivorans]NKY02320.1 glycosyltransferase family 2 protein [Gordonia polyisoprenivorans]WCB39677.1 glycosyltransferase family 2 protein [Gordonia polyisoprenivorans]GAB23453.1 putative glycosyltransferase [Gordonia polyisoprenivorans NBRC 16320 = JCM 10675]
MTSPHPHDPHPHDDGICVVICCYTDDRMTLLTRAIDAVTAQLHPADRLVVVTDHNDALGDRVKTLVHDRPARIDVVPNGQTRGLSGARNTGLRCATEDLVVFLDDDAVLRPGGLADVRRAFRDPSLLAIGGRVEAAWSGIGAPGWFPDEFGWVVGCDYRGIAPDGADIRNPIGAAMAVRRTALVEIGGFAGELGRVGDLPVGCEETLMGIELHRRFTDGRIVRRAGFAVDHSVTESRATLRYFFRRCLHEGRSKAVLRRMAGTNDAFSAETSYVLRTIPTGILRYLGQLLRGDLGALARLLVMVLGVAVTAAGTVSARRGGGPVTARRGGGPVTAARAPYTGTDTVSVVIPTIGRDLLTDTVRAVLAQNHSPIEVIVVDNRPASGRTRQILDDFDDPRLRVVDEPFPGISAARNAGIAAATGRIIAFTDDDAQPRPDWVSTIVETFVRDSTGTIGAVTGRVVGVESLTELQQMFEDARVFDKGEDLTVWALRPHPTHVAAGVAGEHNFFFPYTAGQLGSGNNLALAAEILPHTGVFDERLGTGTPSRGGEDLDLMRSVILSGWAIAYRPDAVVTHYHRDNMAELRTQSFGYGTGMSASLTKLALSRHGLALAWRIPAGLRALLVPGSENVSAFAREQWPDELRTLERRGYFAGPALFLRGHRRCRGRAMPGTGTGHAGEHPTGSTA